MSRFSNVVSIRSSHEQSSQRDGLFTHPRRDGIGFRKEDSVAMRHTLSEIGSAHAVQPRRICGEISWHANQSYLFTHTRLDNRLPRIELAGCAREDLWDLVKLLLSTLCRVL